MLKINMEKNNRFPFLDILGYLKNTHKNPNQGTWLGIPWLGLVSLCQIWDFYGYSLNTQKYPKIVIRYFFPLHRSMDVEFIFDSAHVGLFRSANILQTADVALRVVFLLFLPCF